MLKPNVMLTLMTATLTACGTCPPGSDAKYWVLLSPSESRCACNNDPGCLGAGGSKTSLKQQDLDSVRTPIHVLHTHVPPAEFPSRAGAILSVTGTVVGAAVGAGAGPALPGAAAAVSTATTGAALSAHSQRINTGCVVPDAGYDISRRFIKAWESQGNAPKLVLIAQPITEKQDISGPTITITITRFAINYKGLYMK